MKQTFKDLLPAILLSITASFMFFIFEPVTMYATNPNDFWFDLPHLLDVLIPTAFVFSLYLFLALLLGYVIVKHFFKKINLYYIIMAIIFCGFLVTYIHGNFLVDSLPGIYGIPFDWHEYKIESIISIGLWLVAFAALIICLIKLKPIKVFSIIPYITGAVFIMLSVSLVSTLLTTNAFEEKSVYTFTYNNFNLASKKQNLFVLLVDAIDAKKFNEITQSEKSSNELLKDFTSFDDALSFYPFTRDSLPYIFSPIPNHNETEFLDYSKDTLAKSKLFKSLKKDDFNMNYFDLHYYMDTKTAEDFKNVVSEAKIEPKPLLKQLIKYDLFKYLPYPLKSKLHIENLNFASTKQEKDYEPYKCYDIYNYDKLKAEPIETTEDKIFNYTYVEGAHVPFNIDENMHELPENGGTYTQKVKASYLLIEAYLNRIKKAGVWDSSAIVLLADHGYDETESDNLGRFNPFLYIKGVNEHHSQTQHSDKPIQYSDLEKAFIQLSQKDQSSDLFKNISFPRTRTILWYKYNHEDHMVEYQTDSKARETNKMWQTGNVYDLKQ